MRVAEIVLLSLMWIQVQGEIDVTPTAALNISNLFCENSFKPGPELRDVYFIAAIVAKLMDKLKSNNVKQELLSKVPAIVGGNLYCDGNLPDTIDLLLQILFDKADRGCLKIPGYTSIFIKPH
ncbi:hypothetical protein KR044_011589 [Drosophila immigrans]|nr:hypothetical protein KR044_011589 [Drosophila immigrans]